MTRFHIKILLMNGLAAAWILASGAHAELPEVVAAALQRQGVDPASVSVVVRRVDVQPLANNDPANKPGTKQNLVQNLVTHNPDKPQNPASTMKLLTTYAGLELLGPAYRWRTELYYIGRLQDGILTGNLVIKGHGDPNLMAEDLWRMLGSLRQAGIKDIRGDVWLDNTWFSPRQNDAGTFDGEPYRAYNATADALAVNLKSTSIKLVADAQRVTVTAEPDLPEISIINQLKPVQKECVDWKSRVKYDVTQQPQATQLVLSGEFSSLCGEKYLDMSLLSSQQYIDGLFRQIWRQLGGSVSGRFMLEPTPAAAVKILQQDSLTLADIVRRINKYSNNFMARQLLLTIAAESGAVPATEEDGSKVIRSWLIGKNMRFPELVLENGAGLSRIDRISAQHLNDLLVSAYASPVMPELMSSLPVLAADGTTAMRLKDSALQGRAHLKTGSLEGVRSIAGYLLDRQGRRWALVFMANGANVNATRAAQDALLQWIYEQP